MKSIGSYATMAIATSLLVTGCAIGGTATTSEGGPAPAQQDDAQLPVASGGGVNEFIALFKQYTSQGEINLQQAGLPDDVYVAFGQQLCLEADAGADYLNLATKYRLDAIAEYDGVEGDYLTRISAFASATTAALETLCPQHYDGFMAAVQAELDS